MNMKLMKVCLQLVKFLLRRTSTSHFDFALRLTLRLATFLSALEASLPTAQSKIPNLSLMDDTFKATVYADCHDCLSADCSHNLFICLC